MSDAAPNHPFPLHRLAMLAGLLTGFTLRLYQLGGESLWYDEIVSVYLARKSIPEMIAHTAGDIHPPGYYLLLHLWQSLTHPTAVHGLEFLFAWPSLVAGMLILVLIYALGRRLLDPSIALVALWLGALNPFQLWYSQEVRMYTVGAALGLLGLWALLKFLDGRRRLVWLTLYVLCAAAGLYTLYYFAFLLVALNIIALGLIWLGGSRPPHATQHAARNTLHWLAAQVAVFLLWSPWLPIFQRQVTDPPVPPWRTPWLSVGDFAQSLAETLAAPWTGQSPPGAAYWPWAIVGAAVLVAFCGWTLRQDAARRRAGATLLAYAVLPTAMLYVMTLVVTPIYHVRYLFIFAPPFLLMTACVVVAIYRWRHWLGATLAASLVAVEHLESPAILVRPALSGRRPPRRCGRAGARLATWRRHSGQRRLDLPDPGNLLADRADRPRCSASPGARSGETARRLHRR